jgi:hypothetical protein
VPRFIAPLVLTAALALTGCEVVDAGDPGSTAGPGPAPTGASEARTELDALTIAAAASMKGYSRDKFPHWDSAGSNCDVRDTVLKRDGDKVKFSGCNVVAGTWNSFYDDQVITSPTKVDIDHMVPLANAWRSGAAKWDNDKRGDFANDLDRPQLFAVSASSNRSKGDQDPSTWKPPSRDSWCTYAVDWVTVKSYWELTVTEKEKEALTDMLETC